MSLVDELSKVLRFSWEVEDRRKRGLPLQANDKMIRTSLLTENQLDPCFLKPPDSRLVQAIALPSVLAMIHSKDRFFAEYNPWRKGQITRESSPCSLRRMLSLVPLNPLDEITKDGENVAGKLIWVKLGESVRRTLIHDQADSLGSGVFKVFPQIGCESLEPW